MGFISKKWMIKNKAGKIVNMIDPIPVWVKDPDDSRVQIPNPQFEMLFQSLKEQNLKIG